VKRKLIRSCVWCVLLLLVAVFPVAGADEITAAVDKVFAKWDSTHSPGAALAVIRDGEIVYARGYGMANLELGVPITPTTVFRIGSTSKQFTAASIALLSLQGKLSLGDDIRKWVPELPEFEDPITIRHLVHHTSGMRDYLVLSTVATLRGDDYYTPGDTLDMLSRQKGRNFRPGDEHFYCNSGYFLMGVIVERASGKTLAEFAREQIFEPLGMENTHFHDDHTMVVKKRADGYSPTEDGYRIDMTTLDHVGDGGVFTTVEDLYLWDQAFYTGRLGEELMDLMHTTGVLNNGEKLDYAFGLMVDEYRGLKRVHHAGGFVGFRADLLRFPEQRFSVVCLANLGSIDPPALAMEVAEIYLADEFTEDAPETAAPGETHEAVTLTPQELERRAGSYLVKAMGVWAAVTTREGGLVINVMGQEIVLTPVGATSFVAEEAGIAIDFPSDDAAVITMMGQKYELVRAPRFDQLTPVQLASFIGDYSCEELLVTYEIAVRDGALFFTHRNAPEEALVQVGVDIFSVGMFELAFERGKKSRVIGFKLDAGRASDIAFVKK